MLELVLVGCGGFLGSISRYLMGAWVMGRVEAAETFPYGTFAVNLLGCILAGIFLALHEASLGQFRSEARLLCLTGFLGGFTTLSAFGVETFSLIRRGDIGLASVYVAVTVIAAILATAAAFWLSRRLM
ncbi:MAG: fluoride efflux transporter CrcB [Oligoflexia bacterium]|nr:fluoride efflux transporter CrcB [Oligoflexia bacterium]